MFKLALPSNSINSPPWEPMKVSLGDEATKLLYNDVVIRDEATKLLHLVRRGSDDVSNAKTEPEPTERNDGDDIQERVKSEKAGLQQHLQLAGGPLTAPPGLNKITLQEALFGDSSPTAVRSSQFGVDDPRPLYPDPPKVSENAKQNLGGTTQPNESKDAAQSAVKIRLLNALLAYGSKTEPANTTADQGAMIKLDLNSTLFPKANGNDESAVPIPFDLLKNAMENGKLDEDLIGPSCPSIGSFGHPNTCGMSCKYNEKQSGCKDGKMCTRCHICKWNRKIKRRCGRSFAPG